MYSAYENSIVALVILLCIGLVIGQNALTEYRYARAVKREQVRIEAQFRAGGRDPRAGVRQDDIMADEIERRAVLTRFE